MSFEKISVSPDRAPSRWLRDPQNLQFRPSIPCLLVAAVLLLPSIGCSGETAPAPGDSAPAESTEPQAQGQDGASQGGDTSGMAPVTSRSAAVDSDPSAETIQAPGAIFTMPSDWVQQTPSSSMRLAQAEVPGPAGNGTLTVFFFGPGGGGPIDDNLNRWVGQMELAAGSEPSRETFEVGAYKVTWTQVHGTLKSGTMGGPAEAQPDYSLLGAVVEGNQGPWFFKIIGPGATLDAQKEAFLNMLRSVRTP